MKEFFQEFKIKKLHAIIFIVVIMWFGLVYYYVKSSSESDIEIEKLTWQIEQKNQQLKKYEHLYQVMDSTYRARHDEIDSLQTLRNENDSIIYDFSPDSLERIWAERFSNH